MSEPLKILMIGHTCSPFRGSEPGGVWNWASHIAEHHHVWLICHPQYRHEYDQLPAGACPRHLHIEWTSLPGWIDPWKPARSDRWLRLHYMFWLRKALSAARELHRVHRFDIVHQVGLGTISAPSPFWRLGIPLFWGPIGGGQVAPPAFRSYFGWAWISEALRSLRVRAMPYSRALRSALARCSVVIAANEDTRRLAESAGARNVRTMIDSGVPDFWLAPEPPVHPQKSETVLIWWGRLEAHKALGIGLEALAEAQVRNVRLWVAGDGPMRARWEAEALQLGISERVHFFGRVQREQLRELASGADAFLFTSLRESFGSVVLEAMGSGLPVIALAHQGVGGFLSDLSGLKVPVTSPEQSRSALAHAIDSFAAMTAAERHAMSKAAWQQAAAQRWADRAATVVNWYREFTSGCRSGDIRAATGIGQS